jgi:hypothetical protein
MKQRMMFIFPWQNLKFIGVLTLFVIAASSGYAQGKPSPTQAQADAPGRFYVQRPGAVSAKHQAWMAQLKESELLQTLAESMNELFVIPQDISIVVDECGEANAYFSSDDSQIRLCVELLEDMDEALAESYPDDDARSEAVFGAFTAVFFHELGHALVSVLELPVTGREEDAVDQLSTWILIEGEMNDAVLSAAETYYAAEDDADDDTFADEHSLNRQRYFNMVCWVYGSKPEAHEDLLEAWALPEARAERCEDEYAQISKSWATLLAEHVR